MSGTKTVKKTLEERVEIFIEGLEGRLDQVRSALEDAKVTLEDCERAVQDALASVEESEYEISNEVVAFIEDFQIEEDEEDRKKLILEKKGK